MEGKTIEEILLGQGFKEADEFPFLQIENPVIMKWLPCIAERMADNIAKGKIKRFVIIPYGNAVGNENVLGIYYNVYVLK